MRSYLAALLLVVIPAWAQSSGAQDHAVTAVMDRLVSTPGVGAWTPMNVKGQAHDDPAVQGGQALRVTSTKGANPWDSAVWVGIKKPVKKGDVLFVAFWARVEAPPVGSTTATLPVAVSMSNPPYTGQFNETVTITDKWTLYFASGTVDGDYDPGKLTASILLGADAKTIDLGPVYILDYGPNYDVSKLPHNKPVAMSASAPGLAQTGQPVGTIGGSYATALANLRAKLPVPGTLISDPAQAVFGFGPDQSNQTIAASDVAGGKAVRFNLKQGQASWSDGAGVPLTGAIKRGDTIVMAMYARSVAPPQNSPSATLSEFGVHMSVAPWTAIATSSARLVGNQWQIVYASGVAQDDYAVGAAGAGIQLGCCTQALDIGPVFVLNLGQNVPVSSLPKSADTGAVAPAELAFTPFKANGLYALGDKVGWAVSPLPTAKAGTTYKYRILANGAVEIGKGVLDLSKGGAEIAITLDHPASVYVTVDRSDAPPQPAGTWIPPLQAHATILGAVVAPQQLAPAAPRPADFDAFWAAKIAELNKVPMKADLTEVTSPASGVKLYKVKLDSLNSHVQGYLAVPDKPGPFPAIIQYQWAGVYALMPWNCVGRAAQGWLCLNVSAHDMPPDQASGAPANYAELGNTSRETSYFLDMYLRDTRALDWLRSLPQWNKTTLVLNGGSMGGKQSLVTAGLNPGKVTAVIVNQPAGSDSGASLNGRMPAYPMWPMSNPGVAATAPYFDTANFTPKITAPTLVAVGLIDSVCPPTSIYAAANLIAAPHEVVPMPESEHGSLDKQAAFLKRSEEVLEVLRNGGAYVPRAGLP